MFMGWQLNPVKSSEIGLLCAGNGAYLRRPVSSGGVRLLCAGNGAYLRWPLSSGGVGLLCAGNGAYLRRPLSSGGLGLLCAGNGAYLRRPVSSGGVGLLCAGNGAYLRRPVSSGGVGLLCAGDGAYLRRPLSSGGVGLLRRVQPSGGAHAVGRLAADPDDSGGVEEQRLGERKMYVMRRFFDDLTDCWLLKLAMFPHLLWDSEMQKSIISWHRNRGWFLPTGRVRFPPSAVITRAAGWLIFVITINHG